MDSREIVRRTLDFEGPERVARSFSESDLVWAGNLVNGRESAWRRGESGRWERTDIWGNLWTRVDDHSMGEVAKGVLGDLSRVSTMELPDFSHADDYEPVRRERKKHPDKWLIGGLPGFAFSIARKMRRLDQYLVDVLVDRDAIHALHDRLDVLLEDMIRNYAEAGADSVMFAEDWGTQSQTLVNPDLWYDEFYPRFERLCSIAKECGVRVFMHSCGRIEAIVPGLIKAGISVLQFDQPALHGIGRLAECQKDSRITFWCPVDIQTTLQTKDEESIRSAAREMLDRLWKGRGGFIAGYYGDNASIGLDPKWQEYACDEFIRCGVKGNHV